MKLLTYALVSLTRHPAFAPAALPSKDKSTPNEPTGSGKAESTVKPKSKLTKDDLAKGNPNLSSFEAVMQAMDEELARSRNQKGAPSTPKIDKGKGKAKATVEDVEDIEGAMDAELSEALNRGSEDDDDDGFGDSTDYTLIKNFLESFKSQGGLSGPVGNLVGRLQEGWSLPRDDA